MPTYTYRCGGCKKEFDVFVLGQGKKVKCPVCGSENLERVFKPFKIAGSEKSSKCSSCSSSSGGAKPT
ncbi:MAG: zinc ribbon domain-containing protein [Planctomycetota bacterium]|nr:zinc ribbon domain-containing protein [Planctomycetota bacterium]